MSIREIEFCQLAAAAHDIEQLTEISAQTASVIDNAERLSKLAGLVEDLARAVSEVNRLVEALQAKGGA